MTLDGAIEYYRKEADKYYEYGIETECYQVGKEMEQLAEWLTELKEAKRLLALAVEDFKTIGEVRATPTPMIHPKYREYTRIIDILDLNWRHTDEALKLIGND
jgi:hypothetical protein